MSSRYEVGHFWDKGCEKEGLNAIEEDEYESEFRLIERHWLKSIGSVDENLEVARGWRAQSCWANVTVHLIVDQSPLFKKCMHSIELKYIHMYAFLVKIYAILLSS